MKLLSYRRCDYIYIYIKGYMIVTDMVFELYFNDRTLISSFVIVAGWQDDANSALNVWVLCIYACMWAHTTIHTDERFSCSNRRSVKDKKAVSMWISWVDKLKCGMCEPTPGKVPVIIVQNASNVNVATVTAVTLLVKVKGVAILTETVPIPVYKAALKVIFHIS